MLATTKRTVVRARTLRRTMTLPEVLLWRELRKRPEGHKFRRQHPSGPFVIDFYCESACLAIEIDGMAHDMGRNPARDSARDQWFAERGVTTLRIRATDVLEDLDAVLRHIVASCQTPPPHFVRSPSPPGRI